VDVWDSTPFLSIFLASSFSCDQTLSTLAPSPETQTVNQAGHDVFVPPGFNSPLCHYFLGWFKRYNGRQTIEAGQKKPSKSSFRTTSQSVPNRPSFYRNVSCCSLTTLSVGQHIGWPNKPYLPITPLMFVSWEQNGK
jgi:hypothetical protein